MVEFYSPILLTLLTFTLAAHLYTNLSLTFVSRNYRFAFFHVIAFALCFRFVLTLLLVSHCVLRSHFSCTALEHSFHLLTFIPHSHHFSCPSMSHSHLYITSHPNLNPSSSPSPNPLFLTLIAIAAARSPPPDPRLRPFRLRRRADRVPLWQQTAKVHRGVRAEGVAAEDPSGVFVCSL
jgi:hypothetical protein